MEWVGVNVGIMDQLISSTGKKGKAVIIDCRSLDYSYVDVPDDINFFVLDTATRRQLTNSKYNTRRLECEKASSILGVKTLRDADLNILKVNLSCYLR